MKFCAKMKLMTDEEAARRQRPLKVQLENKDKNLTQSAPVHKISIAQFTNILLNVLPNSKHTAANYRTTTCLIYRFGNLLGEARRGRSGTSHGMQVPWVVRSGPKQYAYPKSKNTVLSADEITSAAALRNMALSAQATEVTATDSQSSATADVQALKIFFLESSESSSSSESALRVSESAAKANLERDCDPRLPEASRLTTSYLGSSRSQTSKSLEALEVFKQLGEKKKEPEAKKRKLDVTTPSYDRYRIADIALLKLSRYRRLPCTIAVGHDGIGFATFRWSKLSFFFAIVKFLVGL
ncbi:hypothetical protein L596_025502 [Steinernema carpocapsae]|uniref:Uncharacterized protein n=1 Tax=Steinernema carpocapsae TaxID=34508 RepID=A0A4U5M7Z1_STECR|nr:hypothetical protein L596_025502 [Steinernema carpocapsae]